MIFFNLKNPVWIEYETDMNIDWVYCETDTDLIST